MTDLRTEVPADWYPDPTDPAHVRYWDGSQYTSEAHWDGVAWVECDPGWWRAADNLMYPPERHPDVQAPVPTPPTSIPGTWVSAASFTETSTPTETLDPEVRVSTTAPGQAKGGRVRRLAVRRRWVIVAAFVCVVVLVVGGLTTLTGKASGWTDPSLHVVGSPVTANGMVIVLDVRNHHLELSGVNPGTGSVAWSQPFSASDITPGVAFGPTVLDGTVLGLAPAGTSDDPSVTVEGIYPVTGKILWSVPQPLVVTDAPAVCAGGAYFCIAGPDTATTTALALIDPATGSIGGVDEGPARNMAVAQPGSTSLETSGRPAMRHRRSCRFRPPGQRNGPRASPASSEGTSTTRTTGGTSSSWTDSTWGVWVSPR